MIQYSFIVKGDGKWKKETENNNPQKWQDTSL